MGGHRGATAHARLPFMNGGLEEDWLRAAENGYGSRSLFACPPSPPPSFIYLFFCEWRAGGDSCARTAPSARPEGNGGSGRGGGGGGSGTPVPLGAERGWGQPSCSGCGPVAVVPHPHLLLLVHSSCVLCWQHRCEKARKS